VTRDDDYMAMETMIERTGTPWVSVGTIHGGWAFLTEQPVIEGSDTDVELALYWVDYALRWPSMSKECGLRYGAGLFSEYTKMAEVKG